MTPQLAVRTVSLFFTAVFIVGMFIPDNFLSWSIMMIAGLPQVVFVPAICVWDWKKMTCKRREEVLELFTQ